MKGLSKGRCDETFAGEDDVCRVCFMDNSTYDWKIMISLGGAVVSFNQVTL